MSIPSYLKQPQLSAPVPPHTLELLEQDQKLEDLIRKHVPKGLHQDEALHCLRNAMLWASSGLQRPDANKEESSKPEWWVIRAPGTPQGFKSFHRAETAWEAAVRSCDKDDYEGVVSVALNVPGSHFVSYKLSRDPVTNELKTQTVFEYITVTKIPDNRRKETAVTVWAANRYVAVVARAGSEEFNGRLKMWCRQADNSTWYALEVLKLGDGSYVCLENDKEVNLE